MWHSPSSPYGGHISVIQIRIATLVSQDFCNVIPAAYPVPGLDSTLLAKGVSAKVNAIA